MQVQKITVKFQQQDERRRSILFLARQFILQRRIIQAPKVVIDIQLE